MKRSIRFDDSSNVRAAAYDGDTSTLVVTFDKGNSYRYGNVQPHQFAALCAASSAGSWVRAELVKQPVAYPCTRLEGPLTQLEASDKLGRMRVALELIASLPKGDALDPTAARFNVDRARLAAQEAIK